MTLNELAGKIGATLARGDGAQAVRGLANLVDAGPDQLAPYTDASYAERLTKTRAGAILTKSLEIAAGVPETTAVLVCADPELAMIHTVQLLYPPPVETPGVDARALVEPGVEVGAGCHVGAFAVVRSGTTLGAGSVILPHAVIGRNCVIGEGSMIHSHATLYDGVQLGKRVMIHSGAVIGADGFGYKFRGGKHVKVPQIGTVVLGDDVEIGANTCIDRGALGPTKIGTGSKIDNLVQIGHNVTIGNHCIVCGQAALAGSSGMGDYAVLGGNVGVADHIFVGKGAKCGAKSGIGKDVPPGTEVWGLFAEERKIAFRQLAAYRRMPDVIEKVRELEQEVARLREEPGS